LLRSVRQKPADVETNKGMAENSITADLSKYPVLVRGRISCRYRKNRNKRVYPMLALRNRLPAPLYSRSQAQHSCAIGLNLWELALDKTSCTQLYLVTAEGCGIGPKRLSCRHRPPTNRHSTNCKFPRGSQQTSGPEVGCKRKSGATGMLCDDRCSGDLE
jgi:hypothetical protein